MTTTSKRQGSTPLKVGERRMRQGIRERRGARGTTYQIKVGKVWMTLKDCPDFDTAAKRRDDERVRMHKGRQVTNRSMTVGEHLAEYRQAKHSKKKASTQKAYGQQLDAITEELGSVKLTKLTTVMVQEFIDGLRNRRNGDPAEFKTKQGTLRQFRAALADAMKQKGDRDPLVNFNAAEDVELGEEGDRLEKNPMGPRETFQHDLHVLTAEHIRELTHALRDKARDALNACRAKGNATPVEWDRAREKLAIVRRVEFQAWTGLRSSELLGLTYSDIVESKKTKSMRAVRIRPKPGRSLKTANSKRIVTLSPRLAEIIEEQRNAQRTAVGEFSYRDDWYIFSKVTSPTTPITDSAYRASLCNVTRFGGGGMLVGTRFGTTVKSKHGGVDTYLGLTPHDLRHALVTLLFLAGWDDYSIERRTGDTLAVLKEVYAHDREQRDLLDAEEEEHEVPEEIDTLYRARRSIGKSGGKTAGVTG